MDCDPSGFSRRIQGFTLSFCDIFGAGGLPNNSKRFHPSMYFSWTFRSLKKRTQRYLKMLRYDKQWHSAMSQANGFPFFDLSISFPNEKNVLIVDTVLCCHVLWWRAVNTGLFEMIVGVITTCHTQYTWDRNICIFLFNRTTLQVFVIYLTGALYVQPLGFYKQLTDIHEM